MIVDSHDVDAIPLEELAATDVDVDVAENDQGDRLVAVEGPGEVSLVAARGAGTEIGQLDEALEAAFAELARRADRGGVSGAE